MIGKELSDRRIQRTQKALQDALIDLMIEKEFDKISVQDVVKRANIGRSTFYSHYKDIEDLFLSGFENLWLHFEEYLSAEKVDHISVWEISLIVFQHARNYIPVYKALAGKQSGRLMTAHMHKYLTILIRRNLKEQWPESEQIPLEIIVFHLTTTLVGLLTWWVDRAQTYTPKRMNEIFQQLTEPVFQPMHPIKTAPEIPSFIPKD